jgi:hypothetical protein
MGTVLLIGITGAPGLAALGLGVIVLDKSPPARPSEKQAQVSTSHRTEFGRKKAGMSRTIT